MSAYVVILIDYSCCDVHIIIYTGFRQALGQYISGIRLLNLNTAFTEQVNAEERKFNQ